ncbi:hypothetical protein EEW87_17575 (plasmid) [Janibacter melonis]|uniref:Uncharacterized protein n=1 Tax=Janibacter melonis TaxID=262209 RepID=A0A650GFQ2_9MICO|nr:hypothetical protein [Janibacter melonis]QGX08815.1 hypothetical protein EEW87_17575 [Janibacter melonis]
MSKLSEPKHDDHGKPPDDDGGGPKRIALKTAAQVFIAVVTLFRLIMDFMS